MADKSAEKERLFNEWFTKSYDRLRGTLRRYGMLDEDNFHDTYLFVRKQVLVPGKDITDYDAYFVGCYKKAALVKIKRENRKRTATDCTRPAERAGFTFFHNTGESSKPTILSRIRRACWAFTRFTSMSRGFSMAFSIAVLVISWNTMRLVFSGSSPKTSNKCHEIASPSRSSSDASHTISAFFASAFNSATNFFLHQIHRHSTIRFRL